MTQIGHCIAPTRRVNALGAHSLDHFALAVPNLEEARRYYASFGPDVRERGSSLHPHTHGHPQLWGVLSEEPLKALRHLSFGIFADDVERFHAYLQRCGIARLDPPAGTDSNGFWFRDLDGTLVEPKVAEKSSQVMASNGERFALR